MHCRPPPHPYDVCWTYGVYMLETPLATGPGKEITATLTLEKEIRKHFHHGTQVCRKPGFLNSVLVEFPAAVVFFGACHAMGASTQLAAWPVSRCCMGEPPRVSYCRRNAAGWAGWAGGEPVPCMTVMILAAWFWQENDLFRCRRT